MLPPQPPALSNGDFDPSQPLEDEDAEMQEEEQEGPNVQLSSVEINILIYLYLLESNLTHSAFTLLSESALAETSLFQHFNPTYPTSKPNSSKSAANGPSKHSPATSTFGEPNGRIKRGELVSKLWKALRWEDIERHVGDNGEPYTQQCPNPFHLLIPHSCPSSLPSAINNPPKSFPTLRMSPPDERPEAFPPADDDAEPDQASAGPSRRKRDTGSAKRRSRRTSDASTAPTRSVSPASRRRRKGVDEDEDMAEEEEEEEAKASTSSSSRRRKHGAVTTDDTDNLSVPAAESRSKSPVKRGGAGDMLKSAAKLGKGNPLFIPESDIGVFLEHRDIVNGVAWNSKNVDLLASASNDSTARFWDMTPSTTPGSRALELSSNRNGKSVIMSHKSIESNKKAVTALSWHPEGTFLVTAAGDGVGRMFTPNGTLEGILAYGRGGVNAIKFSPNGSQVLTATLGRAVNLFNVTASGPTMACSFDSHTDEVNDVDWLDDTVFASAANDHKICIHRIDDRRPHYTFKAHTDDVTRIKWSPAPAPAPGPGSNQSQNQTETLSRRYLASVSDDGRLMVWQMDRYPHLRGGTKSSGSVSPSKKDAAEDGDDYFGLEEHLVVKWQVVEASENKRMNALEWSPERADGRMLLAAGGQDSTIRIYDVLSKQCIHSLAGFENGTGSLSFSPAGFRGTWGAIAGGSWDAAFRVWDVETGEVLKEYEMEADVTKQQNRDRPFVTSTAWKPDGEHVAVGLRNKSVMTFYVGDLRQAPASAPGSGSEAITAKAAEDEGMEIEAKE